jgi:hypothetical protein
MNTGVVCTNFIESSKTHFLKQLKWLKNFLSENPKSQSRLNPKGDSLLRVRDNSLKKTQVEKLSKENKRGLNFIGGTLQSIYNKMKGFWCLAQH